MVFKCCVPNCKKSNKEVKVHSFPYLDQQLYRRWLSLIGRQDLIQMHPEKVHRNYRVCDYHFANEVKIDTSKYAIGRTNLVAGACPTILMPAPTEQRASTSDSNDRLTVSSLEEDAPQTTKKTRVEQQEIIYCIITTTRQVKFTFRGLMAPTLTAYKDDLSINLDVIQDYAKFLADSKIMGILVNGTSGEGMSMNVDERKKVTEEWVKAVKKTNQHLMVQIGGAPLPDVLELARHAEAVGVHSLLCLPDLYNKPNTPSDLIRYLKIVGAAAPNTPLLYYHIPSYTHVNIHMGQFLNESVDKIPTFHGIKFTSTALDEGVAAIRANGGKYAVFLGADQLMAGAYTLGFDSAIATSLNMFPQLGIDILEAVKKSKLDKARETQNALTEVCSIVTKNGSWVPTMKVAMNLYTPINVGKAREPLVNITDKQIKEMEVGLKAVGIKK